MEKKQFLEAGGGSGEIPKPDMTLRQRDVNKGPINLTTQYLFGTHPLCILFRFFK